MSNKNVFGKTLEMNIFKKTLFAEQVYFMAIFHVDILFTVSVDKFVGKLLKMC